jgi:hypothetical protein
LHSRGTRNVLKGVQQLAVKPAICHLATPKISRKPGDHPSVRMFWWCSPSKGTPSLIRTIHLHTTEA